MNAADSEVAYLVSYRCACCQSSLQAPARRKWSWLRCPTCGKGGLPPDQVVRRTPPKPVEANEDLLVIGPSPDLPKMTPVATTDGQPDWDIERAANPERLADGSPGARRPDLADEPGNGLRVAYAWLLFLSLTLLLFSFLNQSLIGTSLGATLAMLAFLLLARSGVRRHAD